MMNLIKSLLYTFETPVPQTKDEEILISFKLIQDKQFPFFLPCQNLTTCSFSVANCKLRPQTALLRPHDIFIIFIYSKKNNIKTVSTSMGKGVQFFFTDKSSPQLFPSVASVWNASTAVLLSIQTSTCCTTGANTVVPFHSH